MSAGASWPDLPRLRASGECGRLLAERSWEDSPIGPIDGWPQSLRTTLGTLLASPVPMVLLWGPEGVMLYNDPYAVFAGGRHPTLLGAKVREGWPEVADFNDNVMRVGLAGGTLSYRDQELTLYRHGEPEQVFMNLDYSPVPGEDGAPAGVLAIVQETTERVAAERRRDQAEAGLRAQYDRIQDILDSMGEGFVLFDGDGRVTDLNAEALRMDGRQREAMLGRTYDEIYPDAAPQVSEAVRKALATRQPSALSHRHVWPDGRDSFIDMRMFPFEDGVAVFYRDVTDSQRAQRALAEREKELHTLTDALPVLISYIDRERRYRFVNKIYETWFPRKRADIVGRSMQEVVGEAAYALVAHHIDAALAGNTVRYEQFMPYSEATPRHIEVEYVPRFGEDGSVEGFYSLVQDVTDRALAQAALRESEARLRALTDNLPSGMVYQMAVDPTGTDRRFLYVSQSHLKLTGIAAEDVLEDASIAYGLILPEDRPALAEAEERAIASRSAFDIETRFRRNDGEVRWCRIISAPRSQPDGSMIWDGIQIDITDQKQAEANLRGLNANLEQRVREEVEERSRAEEALRQAQKLEAMGQLTGGVAHDFNNLLTPIIGSLDMLQRSGLSAAREQRLVDGALQSAERAKTLVQRLLAFARRQPLQPGPVDIGALAKGMADLIASTSGPRIRLVIEVDEGAPPAHADANQLEMALLNLCVNARDAMAEGGQLSISVASELLPLKEGPRLPPGRYVCLTVADTGVGMSPETLQRAVEPFFSTKGIGRGTGLGLSMVHGLAAQLGGALEIESKPGLGTRVRLWLPASGAAARQTGEVSTPAAARTSSGLVMLVDDEDLVRASTADMLAELGYEVREFTSAEAALRAMEADGTPELLVTDHLMPGMTGAELARIVRKLRPGASVLIISGYAESDGIAADLPRLTKPFRQSELAAAIGELAPGV